MSVITPNSRATWEYISLSLGGEKNLTISKEGNFVIIKFEGNMIILPPYPRIKSVELIEINGRHIPINVPSDWVAQWKANGSNIRCFSIEKTLLVFLRGGYLLEWKPYSALLNYSKIENLIELSSKYLIFGELVGPKSLVGECKNGWRNFLGEDIGILIFEIYDFKREKFIPVDEAESLCMEYGLDFIRTEWTINLNKLYEKMKKFRSICEGKMWEGFVLKNRERGNLNYVKYKTLKWRLDQIPELMVESQIVFGDKARKFTIINYKGAFRKFLLEGYLDPPYTKESVDKDAFTIRKRILELVEKGRKERERQNKIKVSNEIYKQVLELCNKIFPEEIKGEENYIQVVKEIFKTINRLIWTI